MKMYCLFGRGGIYAIVILIFIFFFQIAEAKAGYPFRTAPLDKNFLEFLRLASHGINNPQNRELVRNSSSPVPFPFKGVSPNQRGLKGDVSVPSSFDLRNEELVTPASKQGEDATDAVFAAIAAMESNHLLKTHKKLDLSEMHLAWFLYKDSSYFDMLGDNPLKEGSSPFAVMAVLARGTGAVPEEACPYGSIPQKSALSYGNILTIRGAYLPGNTIEAKKLMMKYGAVCVAFALGDKSGFDYEKGTIYRPDEVATYEPYVETVLIGWDDTFPAHNFIKRPPGDGAWLLKTSFGNNGDEGGYFWISYYDRTLIIDFAYDTESPTKYGNIYQHDPLGWTASLGFDSPEPRIAWIANIFSATNDEKLIATSFYTTEGGAAYEISVYKNVLAGQPTSGSLVLSRMTGKLDYAGYHTIDFPVPIAVKKGEHFSVVVKITNPIYEYPLAIEMPIAYYSSLANAEKGQSFVRQERGAWCDITSWSIYDPVFAQANVCLKVFGDYMSKDILNDGDKISADKGCHAGIAPIAVLCGVLWFIWRRDKK